MGRTVCNNVQRVSRRKQKATPQCTFSRPTAVMIFRPHCIYYTYDTRPALDGGVGVNKWRALGYNMRLIDRLWSASCFFIPSRGFLACFPYTVLIFSISNEVNFGWCVGFTTKIIFSPLSILETLFGTLNIVFLLTQQIFWARGIIYYCWKTRVKTVRFTANETFTDSVLVI